MRVLLSWLRELVDLPEDAAALAARLTMAGLEVEAIEPLGRGLEKVVVGEIRSREPIAGTKLSICRVFDGATELQIVCGAQNCLPGSHVPLARVGAVLPDGRAIGQAKLRGVESFGMLCSGAELGADDGVDGLLILGPDTVPGSPIAPLLGRDDVAMEVNVTPNRGDALSHLGIARDLSAILKRPLRTPAPAVDPGTGPSSARIEIEAADRCTRFAARVLENVRVGPSPAWLARRLEAVGQRSINNIVDATNYVLFELGQPLHAYDLEKVAGHRLVARLARAGEKLRTLDGKDRELSTDDLVIADAERPVGLAGVMGGEDSEVKTGTTRLLLESAWFSPSTVRRTARRYGLHSEASHRFERGVDAEGTRRALDRLTEIILTVAGGNVAGHAVDVIQGPRVRARIPLRRSRLNGLLGVQVPWLEALGILRRLGLEQLQASDTEAELEIPAARLDLTMEADLIEEVARVWGFESIPAHLIGGAGMEAREDPRVTAEKRLRVALAAAGFDEAVEYAFVSPADLQKIRPDVPPIAIRNPLVQDQAAMRTTLLAGLLRSTARNLRFGVDTVRLYELSRVYLPLTAPPEGRIGSAGYEIDREPRRLGLVAVGPRGRTWTGGRDALDFYDVKGAIEDVLEGLGLNPRQSGTFVRSEATRWLHPRSATSLHIGGREAGAFGELHPSVAEAFDLPRGVLAGELDAEILLSEASLIPPYHGVPKFPASLRDVAIVVDERVTASEVVAEVRRADSAGLVEEVTVFDVYRGKPLPEGKKNLAFSLRFRSSERTLTDEEVNTLHAGIVERLHKSFGAELRT
jgi:phenylalanyl-tRNA synthetase beta chain